MRERTYFLFEIVAWPAAVWCAVEMALRAVTGATAGMGGTGLTGACAVLTIVAVRWRSRQLALAAAG